MSAHRYPPRALTSDWARAGFGLVLTAGPAAAVPADSAALWVLLPLAALFSAFGLRTLRRRIARVELDERGLSLSDGRRASLAWGELQSLKVDYFSTRGDRTGGWMQMTLRDGAGASIRIDSGLDDFLAVAKAAAAAARGRGVALSDATRANLGHLGIAFE